LHARGVGRFVAAMSSLRQIAAAHAPLLFLDAASSRIQVGLWHRDGSSDWRTSDEEAGVGLFRCLEQLDLRIDELAGFVFCEGPGSILGIRTTAMTIRTWNVLSPRPVFAYASLALLAHALAQPDLALVADARRDSWHHFRLGESLRRVSTAELPGELATPDNFRHWSPLPTRVQRVPYSLADLLPRAADADLFRATDEPDAFLHEEPSYVTWTPQIHRAP
jgi:tRNA threonylcarbamoyladenosine biosynthesis protein TsaB